MVDQQTLATFRNQALKLMGSDEADREFGGEVSLESTVYWWHEKYKPRKTKYFNRVHTGTHHVWESKQHKCGRCTAQVCERSRLPLCVYHRCSSPMLPD